MPTKIKKRPPVEVVRDAVSGIEVTIYYDREREDFYGEIPKLGHTRATTVGACAAAIKKVLEESRDFSWQPIISIRFSSSQDRRYHKLAASMSFTFWRSEVAPKPGSPKDFLERPHVADVEEGEPYERRDRKNSTDIADRYTSPPFGGSFVTIPYTEAAWATLNRLRNATSDTYAQLVRLFQTPELLEATSPPCALLPNTPVAVESKTPATRR